jgi:signal transduction histidine kinase
MQKSKEVYNAMRSAKVMVYETLPTSLLSLFLPFYAILLQLMTLMRPENLDGVGCGKMSVDRAVSSLGEEGVMSEPIAVKDSTVAHLAERLKAVEEDNRHLHTFMRESQFIFDCIRRFTYGIDDTLALEDIIEHATKLLGIGDAGIITLYDEGQDCDDVVATYNHDWHVLSKIRMHKGQGATGWSYVHKTPRIYSGIQEVASCLDSTDNDKRCDILASDGRLSNSLIVSPLINRGKVVGAIQIENYTDNRQFNEESTSRLTSFVAAPLAIALDNTGLNNQIIRANRQVRDLLRQSVRAREEERARIARDLHDKIAQTLAGMHIALLNLRSWAEHFNASEKMLEYIDSLDAELRDSIATTQNLTVDLRPMVLNEHGLVYALNRYLKLRVEKAGMQVSFSHFGIDEKSLEDWLSATIYYIAQEALSNVVRHASATKVEVSIFEEAGGLMLLVKDDGIGFNVHNGDEPSLNLGLLGMEERASVLGGNFWLRSKLGEGTEVRAWIPCWS